MQGYVSDEPVIRCYRVKDEDGYLVPVVSGVEHEWVYHSPTGFEWGYSGSGPAELALNILIKFVDRETAFRLHQKFKEEFIAPMPEEGGEIYHKDILKWIEENK